MLNFNNTEEVRKQYGTPGNLNSRAQLHQLYSTNKTGWSKWVFDNYRLGQNQCVLELGCGTGGVWAENADKIPSGTKLTLSDFSPGMLEAAKKNTNGLSFVEYQIIDAQDIPFDADSFDIVIANHMLYHVPDIERALNEIARVLKADGIFYATTIGNNNMRELTSLLHNYNSAIDFAQGSVTSSFGLESGKEILEHHFGSVEVRKYEDSLHITEPQPLIDYVLSSTGIGNVCDVIHGEKVKQFENYVFEIFWKEGCVDIEKDVGIFVSANPKGRNIAGL